MNANEVKKILKEVYLEMANDYSVAGLHYDGDKVACVAGAFRALACRKLDEMEAGHDKEL